MGWFTKDVRRARPQVSPEAVRAAIVSIEQELKRTGIATVAAPTPEALAGAGAFGQPTLAFEQWLVHIFVPRVHQLLDAGGAFPPKSQVGDQAFREWKMWGDVAETDALIDRLRAFDALFH